MQVAALPTPVRRAANSRPTPEISSQAANRLTLIEQWDAMRDEGITAAKAADIRAVLGGRRGAHAIPRQGGPSGRGLRGRSRKRAKRGASCCSFSRGARRS